MPLEEVKPATVLSMGDLVRKSLSYEMSRIYRADRSLTHQCSQSPIAVDNMRKALLDNITSLSHIVGGSHACCTAEKLLIFLGFTRQHLPTSCVMREEA